MTGPGDSSLQPGDQLELEAEGLGDGADALCRVAGRPVFVPGALPGERIRATVTRIQQQQVRARLDEVLSPAPERTEPRCPHFGPCAGCRLQHMAPAAVSRHKFARLQQLLASRLQHAPQIETATPDHAYGTRLRLELRALPRSRPLRFGLSTTRSDARDTPDLFALEQCPATDPLVLDVAHACADEARARHLDALLAIVVQRALGSDDLTVCLVAETGRLPHAQRIADRARAAGARNVVLNIHEGRASRLLGRRSVPILGNPRLRQQVADLVLHTDPTTVTPASNFAAESLVAGLRHLAGDHLGKVVDLYSGAGLTTLALARHADRSLGIELRENATQDAALAADSSNLADRTTFRTERVEAAFTQLEREHPDLVALDPPTAGAPTETLAAIAHALTPARILYVGHSLGTPVRDLRRLEAHGYRAERTLAYDTDPLLPGLLTVTLLQPS